jgi:uncharacterized protein YciI
VSELPPVRREVLVDADQATAFRIFTERIGAWWPLDDLSVFGAGASVAFESGEIVERSSDGRQAVWGTVTRWEPGTSVAFTWHPGGSPDRASHVEVLFSAAESQTLVSLEHAGWEQFDNPAAARDEYDHGWVQVLENYRASCSETNDPEKDGPENDDSEDSYTWVALLHRPGPNAPTTGSIFDAPQLGEHFGFLRRMQESGYLVAAGPLQDADGEGMTILRLPGAHRFEEARVLATEHDQSVVSRFFTVEVRPWDVQLTGL